MWTKIDVAFEHAMCDHWWIQDNAQIVRTKDYEYLKSPKDHRLFNAVIRVSPSFQNHPQLIEEVAQAHKHKGSEWRIGAPSHTPELEKAVLNAGYIVDGMADAWSIDVDASRPPLPSDIVVECVTHIQQMHDWMTVNHQSFSSKAQPDNEKDLEQDLAMCTGENTRTLRFVAYDKHTREPLSSGGINLYPALSLGFMWAGCTVPHARGRGIYSAVVTARLLHARTLGIQRVGLYAMRDTSGPIVQSQGFAKHAPVYFWGRDHTP